MSFQEILEKEGRDAVYVKTMDFHEAEIYFNKLLDEKKIDHGLDDELLAELKKPNAKIWIAINADDGTPFTAAMLESDLKKNLRGYIVELQAKDAVNLKNAEINSLSPDTPVFFVFNLKNKVEYVSDKKAKAEEYLAKLPIKEIKILH